MRYLLDTDWVIHCLHGVARVTDRLDQLAPEGIGLSIVSMAELYQDVFFSTDPDGNERALREFLADVDVIEVDDETCRIFARERGRLRAAGTPIGDFDLLIGATASGTTSRCYPTTADISSAYRVQGLSILSV